MSIAFRYAARSDIGLTRANNQDSAYAGPHLLVVADGMGGHAGGDIASSVAIAHLAPLDGEALGAEEAVQQLEGALDSAHGELLDLVAENPDLAGLGTTVTAILRTGDRLILGHIGDSRAYLLHNNELEQVTVDHTFVQYLVESGKLEPDQAERHPQRSLLLRVLGDVDLAGGLDVSARVAEAGDRWMLCSDGLSSVVSANTIAEALDRYDDPGDCADQLIELALRAGGPDNVTVVVADIVDLDDLTTGEVLATTPQVVGAAAIDRNRPTRGGGGAAGRAASLAPASPTSPQTEVPDQRKRSLVGRRIIWGAVIVLLLGAIGVGLFAGYRWTQTQYYVAVHEGEVTIYQGIAQHVGSFKLSHVAEPGGETGVMTDELSGLWRDRFEQGYQVDSLEQGKAIVAQAAAESEQEARRPATPSTPTTPTPNPSLDPSLNPSLNPSSSSASSAKASTLPSRLTKPGN